MALPRPVDLQPHDPNWILKAEHYGQGLSVLGKALIKVHHIGSTAVPGLVAKPVIDLLPEVSSLEALEALRPLIEALGLVWRGENGLKGRRYCTLSCANGIRLAQFHFYETGSDQIARHLAMRDYLRTHPVVARAYEQEKRRAMQLHPQDTGAYWQEKSDWVRRKQEDALVWATKKGPSLRKAPDLRTEP